ncbi:hypothetical protein RIF29_28758 [Crotalaria pallida]|uniref:Uncharacterized protein n=1 Tax=Crotalaria pallida TaxID=3830 RepID=A0AAN9EE80_CROPI
MVEGDILGEKGGAMEVRLKGGLRCAFARRRHVQKWCPSMSQIFQKMWVRGRYSMVPKVKAPAVVPIDPPLTTGFQYPRTKKQFNTTDPCL